MHPDEIRRHLNTRWMGRDLRCFDLVDSTNTLRPGAGENRGDSRYGRGRRGAAAWPWAARPVVGVTGV